MRVFILFAHLSVFLFLSLGSLHATALAIERQIEARDPYFKSCLCVETEADALCAEGNVASFINNNRGAILQLKNLGVLEEQKPQKFNTSTVKNLLLSIWKSDTRIAVLFSQKPNTAIADLNDFQQQVWDQAYRLHSEEIKSLSQLKQMLNYISALVRLSGALL